MEEIWKDIQGYEGWYQVSNLGRVKRLKKIHCTNGHRIVLEREHILSPSKNKQGYKTVILSNNKTRKHYKVHRLVALSFIPNIYNKGQVDHIDGNRCNNNVKNLRWVTNSENQRNSKSNTYLTAFGKTKLMVEWCEEYKIKIPTLIRRLEHNWDVETAISKPIDTRFYKKGDSNGR